MFYRPADNLPDDQVRPHRVPRDAALDDKKFPGCQMELKKETGSVEQGTVRWFSPRGGYGFIQRDDGREVVVFAEDIDLPLLGILDEGDRVRFEVAVTGRGLQACKVSRL